MAENPFKGPGDDDLKKMLGKHSADPNSTSKPPDPAPDKPPLKSKGVGGLSKEAKEILEARQQADAANNPEDDPEPLDIPTLEPPAKDDKPEEEPAVLSDAKWTEPDTLFHQEAEVSVKLTPPKGKEHITKVQGEVFAKTASGPESISKSEGHAQADGTAVFTFPIYKPKGHDGGPVEYFFEVTHKLAKMLSTIKMPRKVSETALKSVEHVLIPGIVFDHDSSFIHPNASAGLKHLETKFQEWEKKHSKKAQIVVYGHTEKDEKDAKGLSERRAQSAFAFITNNAAAWDKLSSAEKWGLKSLQIILKDLGHYHGTADGGDGPNTQTAFKAFQKGAGLPESGQGDASTRKALFGAYMKGKHDIKIEASRFSQVAGNPWMGCATNNHTKEGERTAPENRRVAFILIEPSKYFPVNFPCQDGSEAACQAQCKKAGKRSAAGIKCSFYDELVREEKQEAAKEEKPQSHDEPAWMPIARKEIGVTEIREEGKDNPRIVEYHQTTRLKAENDEIPWCAAFVNWSIEKSGFKGNGSARAKDWLDWGRAVSEPIFGSIVVVRSGKKMNYHVGFVYGRKGDSIFILGGNQGGGWKVCVSEFHKDIVQGYRLPNEYKGMEIIATEKNESYVQDNADSTR